MRRLETLRVFSIWDETWREMPGFFKPSFASISQLSRKSILFHNDLVLVNSLPWWKNDQFQPQKLCGGMADLWVKDALQGNMLQEGELCIGNIDGRKDSFYWAVAKPHLSSVLDRTFQQGSQMQTASVATLSEARTKTKGAHRNLELENAYPKERYSIFSCFPLLVKNKINKKDIVPSKTHLWARTRQLAISERVINKSEDIQRRAVRI